MSEANMLERQVISKMLHEAWYCSACYRVVISSIGADGARAMPTYICPECGSSAWMPDI